MKTAINCVIHPTPHFYLKYFIVKNQEGEEMGEGGIQTCLFLFIHIFWCLNAKGLSKTFLTNSFWGLKRADYQIPNQKEDFIYFKYIFYYYYYPPSFGIASYVGTAETVTWHLHLTRPYCVALGRVLIWVMSLFWFEELCQLGFLILIHKTCFERDSNHRLLGECTIYWMRKWRFNELSRDCWLF